MTVVRRTTLRSWRIASFVVYFAYEFLKSNVMVLREIYSWRALAAPAIVRVPLRARTPVEIVSMANLINLTPGTLTLEIGLEPPTLFVHGMFARDPDAFLAQLADLEHRLLVAMRPVGQTPAERS